MKCGCMTEKLIKKERKKRRKKYKEEELHFLLVRLALLTKVAGETACGLGSGVGDWPSKGTGLWETAKTTDIFVLFSYAKDRS